ncbi:Hypothetical protein SRAE_X000239600 [Strongyloides ratti]|uniref:Uncharacterized protein n=1 Tax=Strongyloides ratti TaxID=34506 RepID=A0A090MR58_STRRB|nr:Hypothetical protein SRAE_X000239600 [Strongyloides ratti]CEF60663.1 Hypothetical protein SRAE_X000239600 [Strongyloides ratti]
MTLFNTYYFLLFIILGNAYEFSENKKSDENFSLVGKILNDGILAEKSQHNFETNNVPSIVVSHDIGVKRMVQRKPAPRVRRPQRQVRKATGTANSQQALIQQLRKRIADLEFQIQLEQIIAEQNLQQERRNRHLNEIERRRLREARLRQMQQNREKNRRLRRQQLDATVQEIVERAREDERLLLEQELASQTTAQP